MKIGSTRAMLDGMKDPVERQVDAYNRRTSMRFSLATRRTP